PELGNFAVPAAAIGSTPSSRTSRGRRSGAAKKSKQGGNGLWWLIGGGSVVALLLLAGGGWAIMSMMSKGTNGGDTASVPAGQAALVLDWPESDRQGASMLLDGQPVTFSASGPVEVTMSPGQHRLLLRRRGYEPIEYGFSVAAGERHRYTTEWTQSMLAAAQASVVPSGGAGSFGGGVETTPGGLPAFSPNMSESESGPAGFGGWNQLLDVAKRQAGENQRDILIAFTGSDWSSATQHFASEVAATVNFRNAVGERFELVVIDLPRTQDGYNQVADHAQNRHLLQQFRVEAVPVIALTDAAGRPYSVEQYDPSQAANYASLLSERQQMKAERDRLLAAAAQGNPASRLDAAIAAHQWLDEHELLRFYGDESTRWLALSRQVDPKNEAGKQEPFFEAVWLDQLREAAGDEPTRLVRTLEVLRTWSRDHRFVDHDRGARLALLAAGLLVKLERAEEAKSFVDLGMTYQPQDRELREQLSNASNVLASAGQLSSGTGFVVHELGYVLTNFHVIEGPGRLVVRLPGAAEPVTAAVVAQDELADMALLRLSPPSGVRLQPLSVNTKAVGRGARVAVFGYPLGDSVGKGLKLTTGVISGLPDQSTEDMLLLDCRVNPGNSGGPLCDTHGYVIGMVTAKSANSLGVDSYGMAIPADRLALFLQENLPEFAATDQPAPDELAWDAVDRLVSPAVLTILKLK
ncbi:MAG: trypsin-like peptidase domain-containing protein, partial [Planctomycetales bacterium]|nr:trypsin-like peptidase domain-containing protein [Planctomycetales bacterium]